jgi:diguanylate cyclase (GGDEF)-like protein
MRHAMERHRLVRDLERARAEEAHRATHDALTGLPNRTLLFDRLAHALAHASRYERHVAVLFIDLDGFKDVNDTYGHAAGDAMLRAAAERLAGCIRRSDTLARMGGDEFVILFEHVDHPGRAANLAQLVLTRIEGPARIEDRDIPIRLSIGIAVSGVDGETADELLAAADRRMYDMKERGRASAS